MFNLDQFYVFITEYIFDTYRDYNPGVIYPFPFGSTKPDDVVIKTTSEFPDLVFLFYDQEPFWDNTEFLEYYGKQFQELGSTVILITTQRWGRNLDYYCNKFNWIPVYYFHHAVATQDWFRGYALNPITTKKHEITHHIFSLNRLFDGYRPHRRWLISDLYNRNLLDKCKISFPERDPVTKQTLSESMLLSDHKVCNYKESLQSILPLTLDDHENHSFEIDLFHSRDCFVNVVTETVFDNHENYISEKAFKPFLQRMPMIALGPPNVLSTLQEYGFETWFEYWDESYDSVQNNTQRYALALETIHGICQRPLPEIQDMYNNMYPVLEHNYNHFFSENYKKQIVNELFDNLHNAVQHYLTL